MPRQAHARLTAVSEGPPSSSSEATRQTPSERERTQHERKRPGQAALEAALRWVYEHPEEMPASLRLRILQDLVSEDSNLSRISLRQDIEREELAHPIQFHLAKIYVDDWALVHGKRVIDDAPVQGAVRELRRKKRGVLGRIAEALHDDPHRLAEQQRVIRDTLALVTEREAAREELARTREEMAQLKTTMDEHRAEDMRLRESAEEERRKLIVDGEKKRDQSMTEATSLAESVRTSALRRLDELERQAAALKEEIARLQGTRDTLLAAPEVVETEEQTAERNARYGWELLGRIGRQDGDGVAQIDLLLQALKVFAKLPRNPQTAYHLSFTIERAKEMFVDHKRLEHDFDFVDIRDRVTVDPYRVLDHFQKDSRAIQVLEDVFAAIRSKDLAAVKQLRGRVPSTSASEFGIWITDAPTNFLRSTFSAWGYTPGQLATAERNLAPEEISPSVIDYPARKADVVPAKSGQYTLNPDTVGIDWVSMAPEQIAEKTEIVDLYSDPEFKKLTNKSLAAIAAFIVKKYGADRLPGLELERRIHELGDQAPASFKDGKLHFFFGSLFRHSNGSWCVPCVSYDGSPWHRNGYWLESGWRTDWRVVLVKR